MCMLAEVSCALGDQARAARLYELLSPYARCNVLAPPLIALYGVGARYLGMLATTMGRFDEAERHFSTALELNDRQGGRPCVAHTQHQYAVMLLARNRPGDRERAIELLEPALATSRELGMRSLEERAGRLRSQ
jgi:tetratricopeptide (TPR) repeat protein